MRGGVRVPGGELLRAVARPQTAPGQVRELASLAVTAAAWPFGWADRGLHDLRRRLQSRPHDGTVPVLLVHGYGANKSNWFFLERELRAAGFGCIDAFNYNPLRAEVPVLAARCARRARDLMAHAGADRVHLIGHSLGGIIARYAVQVTGLHEAATCITIASPHQGAPLARFGGGSVARQLRPGSALLERLATAPAPPRTRFVAYYSNLDVLVPGRRAMLVEPALGATNVLVKDEGHVSVMLSRRLADSVVSQLDPDLWTAVDDGAGNPPAIHRKYP